MRVRHTPQGLDSTSAMEVLLLARRLSTREDSRSVIATVHQPSAEMFALFDKVRKNTPPLFRSIL